MTSIENDDIKEQVEEKEERKAEKKWIESESV